ncbi:MAG: hypothetical protein NUV64_01550 [Parcubacteria group bacterium]|nr:hypothetical protein [Parcubacteria group bacterium]MCR4342728.1 hypothetical protein [Patescibacteria group bacterium]
MNRKIIIAVVVLAVIGLGAFVFMGRNNEDKAPSDSAPKGFFPDSGSGNINPLSSGSFDGNGLTSGKNFVLIKLSLASVSGATYARGKVIYVDRATGNIYEINPDGTERNRTSNTTIPKIFEADFSSTGDNFLFRYLTVDDGVESVRNFLAGLSSEDRASTTPSVEGVFLPADISSAVISPEENKIFYTYRQGEQTIGVTSDFENKNKKQIFSSSFGQWNLSWPSKNIITLLTKPSGTADGFFYSLDAKTGKFTKILGNIKGLDAILDSSGENVLYNESGQNTIRTRVYNIETGEASEFPLSTLAEKCVFSYDSVYVYCGVPGIVLSALYPDDWYQGLVSFTDLIWKINLSDGNTELIAGISDNFDATNLFLSSNEGYLFFTNKKDSSLWSLRLRE